MKSFCKNFGMAFQLIDDAIDYSSKDKIIGKNVGDDFKEGKITLPIILCYGRSNIEEKKFLKKVFSKLSNNKADFKKTIQLLEKHNCIKDTVKRAQHFSNVAIDSLHVFKNNSFKEALIKLMESSINRIQ